MGMETKYIVVWDDENGICCPMVWDDECEGALHAFADSRTEVVAMFHDKVGARKAIEISTNQARLKKSQGQIANEDFLGASKKNLKIVPLRFKPKDAK